MEQPHKHLLTYVISVVQYGASAIVGYTTIWNSLLCRICHQVGPIVHFHKDPQGHH